MESVDQFDAKQIEINEKEYLKGQDISELISKSPDKKNEIMFIEGPPTMNGKPHAGHLRGRVFKDLWYRYNILSGNNVVFNAGWDTQGLPVELQAEKELGIEKGRKEERTDSEIKELVSACKNIITKYHNEWMNADINLGISLNQENAYWTYNCLLYTSPSPRDS